MFAKALLVTLISSVLATASQIVSYGPPKSTCVSLTCYFQCADHPWNFYPVPSPSASATLVMLSAVTPLPKPPTQLPRPFLIPSASSSRVWTFSWGNILQHSSHENVFVWFQRNFSLTCSPISVVWVPTFILIPRINVWWCLMSAAAGVPPVLNTLFAAKTTALMAWFVFIPMWLFPSSFVLQINIGCTPISLWMVKWLFILWIMLRPSVIALMKTLPHWAKLSVSLCALPNVDVPKSLQCYY